MNLNVLMDDAAGHATAGQQIDLDLVLARAGQERARHRRAIRRRSTLTALAVAAVIGLIAVLLPATRVLRAQQPATVPVLTGLPDHWYDVPESVPPVTRDRMTAAVMVLQQELRTGPIWHRELVRGPVLVSADTRTYAGLPGWSQHDGGVALSADGRRVAWWTAPPPAEQKSVVVHLLTLASGRQRDVRIQPGSPATMTWAGDEIFVAGRWGDGASGTGDRPAVFRITLGGGLKNVCGCVHNELGSTSKGQLTEFDDLPNSWISVPNIYNVANPARSDLLLHGMKPVAPDDVAAPAIVLEPHEDNGIAVLRDPAGAWHVVTLPPVYEMHGDVRDPDFPRNLKQGELVMASDSDWLLTSTSIARSGALADGSPVEPVTSVKALGSNPAGILLLVTSSRGGRPSGTPIHPADGCGHRQDHAGVPARAGSRFGPGGDRRGPCPGC